MHTLSHPVFWWINKGKNVSCLHPSMLSSIPQTNYSVWFSWSNVFPMFITRKISSLAKVFYSHLFFNFPMTCMKRKISHHLLFQYIDIYKTWSSSMTLSKNSSVMLLGILYVDNFKKMKLFFVKNSHQQIKHFADFYCRCKVTSWINVLTYPWKLYRLQMTSTLAT